MYTRLYLKCCAAVGANASCRELRRCIGVELRRRIGVGRVIRTRHLVVHWSAPSAPIVASSSSDSKSNSSANYPCSQKTTEDR